MRSGIEAEARTASPREPQYLGESGAARATIGESARSRERATRDVRTYRTTLDTQPIGAASSPIGVFTTCPTETAAAEVSRLAIILQELQCAAVIRVIGDAPSSLNLSAHATDAYCERPYSLSAPIYDPQGRASSFMEVTIGDGDHPNVARKLVQAITESAADAIAEQWFRTCHHQDWIVAAQATNDQRRILLAVDRDYRLTGANHGARRYLRGRGINWNTRLGINAFFQCNAPADILRDNWPDPPTTFYAGIDGTPWSVRVTSPRPKNGQPSAGHLGQSQSAFTEAIAFATVDTSAGRLPPAGLPLHTRKHIEKFIEARLELGIAIEELAMTAGCSVSHFQRAFRRSYGVPPHQYLMYRQLFRAQDLLTKTRLSLATIALQAGYCDQCHLTRSFRRFIGISPRRFRLQFRGYEIEA